jgi:hypothetical protein
MIILIILLYLNLVYYAILVASVLFITSLFSREIREKIQFKFTKIGKKKTSANYIIELPAEHEDKERTQNIIILAHYDSISMAFHPVFDGVIFFFSLIGGVIFSFHIFIITGLYLLNIIQSIEIIQFFYGFILAVFYSLQLFNKRHNKSLGTADNATAVANSFYCIDYFSKNTLENTNLFFILTGAEEMGDYGADAFIKKHNSEFSKSNTFFFIPDTVGANKETNLYAYAQGVPKKMFSPKIQANIEELVINGQGSYKIQPFYIPPLIHFSTDHAPIKPFGYEFMIFLSNASIHSEKDNINNYHPKMLDNFNLFMRDLIVLMDKNFNYKT